MEITMKENEEMLENLRQEHREVTDECTMLRYKTSLLEEMLDERGEYLQVFGMTALQMLMNRSGIDFRSELQARSNRSMLGQPRSQVPSPVPRGDPQPQIKRRSLNGVAPRQERHVKALGGLPGMQSPHSATQSPSSFTFPNLSPGVQSFDPGHNGPDGMQRSIPHDMYENHRPHLPSGLARSPNNMPPQNPYEHQQHYGHDDSYEYTTQESLRQSQARLGPNRLGK